MTSETSHTALVSLGQAQREIVGRRRGERLVEGRADGRLLHVDRFDLTQLPLRRRLESPPTELREVSGAAHARGGGREQRLRTEEVAERLLGLGVDLAHEECVRPDLPAELRQRGGDEG